jgi:hypothetical protein
MRDPARRSMGRGRQGNGVKRQDLLRSLVLSEISDDYEEPGHVYENVSRRAELCGMTVLPDDVGSVLIDLTNAGDAKAYWLWVDPPREIQEVLSLAHIHGYYFLITDKGKGSLLSGRHEWPLDEEDCVLPGRLPLED